MHGDHLTVYQPVFPSFFGHILGVLKG